MGKTNDALNHFLKDNQEFADLVNLSIYRGKKVVRPDDLSEAGEVIYTKDTNGKMHERRNDVSKYCRNGNTYQIFCLENESKVSYIMPVRVLEYEAGRYMEQIRRIAASHKKEDYRDWNELSSGFTREDRLHPVITLVLYWRREPWDGARSIQEMLDITEQGKDSLSAFLQNYRLNLVNMYELQELESCDGQLKHVLKLLQLDQDKKAIYTEISENPEYKSLKPETGKVIAALLGNERVSFSIEEQLKKKGDTVNMCKALDDLCVDMESRGLEKGIEKGIEQGIEKGLEQGIKQGIRIFILDNLEENVPKERIILKLQRRFDMDEKTADEYYRMYEER